MAGFGRTGFGLSSGDSRAAPDRPGGGRFHSLTTPESEPEEGSVGDFAGILGAGGLAWASGAGLFGGDANFLRVRAADLAFLRIFLAGARGA